MGRNREVDSWNYRRTIEQKIKALELGQIIRFSFETIRKAYPARGDDPFIAALSSGKNRPEPVMTSEDRFCTFLAQEGFVVAAKDMIDAFYAVERGRQKCGKCRGDGRIYSPEPLSWAERTAVRQRESCELSLKPAPCQNCGGRGYLPAAGDPAARFGDHSASDAWIARNLKRAAP